MTKEISIPYISTTKLASYNNQSMELDSTFFYYCYGVTWLGEKIAEFMTREFVAIPFKPAGSYDAMDRGSSSWSAVTRVYQTYIDCVPANITEPGGNDGGAYNFTTDGCSYSFNPLPDQNATRNLMYIGHGNSNGTAPGYLLKSECRVMNIFLGVWGRSRLPSNRSTDIDVAGIFCRTRYSYADVDITVDETTLDIVRPSFIGDPRPLTTEDGIIDLDMFEQYLGAASTNHSVDAFSERAPDTTVRYQDWDLWSPNQVIGYAIGLENKTFDDFRDPRIFGDAMNKTHKLLFNYAIRALSHDKNQPQHVNGTRIVRRDGVVLVHPAAHILTGFLSAVAVCLAAVFFFSYNRPNNLRSDPDTLASTMSLVAQSPQLLRDIERAYNCSDIKGCLEGRRYKLWGREGRFRLDIAAGSDSTPSGGSHKCSTKSHDNKKIRPWELSAVAGAGITIFSAGLLALLAVLFWLSHKYSGWRPPTSFSQY